MDGQPQTRERESFSFTLGVRAIGKATGMTRWSAWRACQNRLLPVLRLGRRWAMVPDAQGVYAAALARELLRREHSLPQTVAAPHQHPRGGGSVPASGAVGSMPVRCKKVTPKVFVAQVVILP